MADTSQQQNQSGFVFAPTQSSGQPSGQSSKSKYGIAIFVIIVIAFSIGGSLIFFTDPSFLASGNGHGVINVVSISANTINLYKNSGDTSLDITYNNVDQTDWVVDTSFTCGGYTFFRYPPAAGMGFIVSADSSQTSSYLFNGTVYNEMASHLKTGQLYSCTILIQSGGQVGASSIQNFPTKDTNAFQIMLESPSATASQGVSGSSPTQVSNPTPITNTAPPSSAAKNPVSTTNITTSQSSSSSGPSPNNIIPQRTNSSSTPAPVPPSGVIGVSAPSQSRIDLYQTSNITMYIDTVFNATGNNANSTISFSSGLSCGGHALPTVQSERAMNISSSIEITTIVYIFNSSTYSALSSELTKGSQYNCNINIYPVGFPNEVYTNAFQIMLH